MVLLDERPGIPPFVVDHHDIHLERYVLAGQEYNVAHQTRVSFEAMLQVILDGKRDGTDRVLDPLVATAGFAYGELVWDREGLGRQWKNRLNPFPPVVKRECVRSLLAHRQAHLTDLTTLMKRADWFKFHCPLVEALRTTMRALFALHEVYYLGDKWLKLYPRTSRGAMLRRLQRIDPMGGYLSRSTFWFIHCFGKAGFACFSR